MHKTGPQVLCVLCVLCAQSCFPAEEFSEIQAKITSFKLDNGLTIILYPRGDAPVISCVTYVKTGSTDERVGITGIAHQLEHLAFKGTPHIGAKDFTAEKTAFAAIDRLYDDIQAFEQKMPAEMRDPFLSLLAREVRRETLEIHAWCVLTTHYHLLVRSPTGDVSGAMERIQRGYSRRFNREERRDGPLVRGRFKSRRVGSLAYRSCLVRYIDANPVQAGLVDVAWRYPFGSAAQYVHRKGPKWLERTWVEAEVCCIPGVEGFSANGRD